MPGVEVGLDGAMGDGVVANHGGSKVRGTRTGKAGTMGTGGRRETKNMAY